MIIAFFLLENETKWNEMVKNEKKTPPEDGIIHCR